MLPPGRARPERSGSDEAWRLPISHVTDLANTLRARRPRPVSGHPAMIDRIYDHPENSTHERCDLSPEPA